MSAPTASCASDAGRFIFKPGASVRKGDVLISVSKLPGFAHNTHVGHTELTKVYPLHDFISINFAMREGNSSEFLDNDIEKYVFVGVSLGDVDVSPVNDGDANIDRTVLVQTHGVCRIKRRPYIRSVVANSRITIATEHSKPIITIVDPSEGDKWDKINKIGLVTQVSHTHIVVKIDGGCAPFRDTASAADRYVERYNKDNGTKHPVISTIRLFAKHLEKTKKLAYCTSYVDAYNKSFTFGNAMNVVANLKYTDTFIVPAETVANRIFHNATWPLYIYTYNNAELRQMNDEYKYVPTFIRNEFFAYVRKQKYKIANDAESVYAARRHIYGVVLGVTRFIKPDTNNEFFLVVRKCYPKFSVWDNIVN